MVLVFEDNINITPDVFKPDAPDNIVLSGLKIKGRVLSRAGLESAESKFAD